MAVQFDQIGSINMALVLAIRDGKDHAAGYPMSDYLHDAAFNYDLSYGLHAIANKKSLSGGYRGAKYYCYDKNGIDMKKRIVHIYDTLNAKNPQTFYRLIHSNSSPGARDNAYSACDLITDIP